MGLSSRFGRLLAGVIACVVMLGQAVRGADPADWPTYNHDAAGWRFNSAEKTLGPSNVGKLVEKWRFPAADSTAGVCISTGSLARFGLALMPQREQTGGLRPRS